MKTKLIITILSLIVVVILLIRPYWVFMTKTLKISPLLSLISKDSLKTFDGQINMAVLGIPGGNYEGPNLSDSITIINYDFKSNKLTTFSIPRDIWSETLQDKINSAYAYGEAKAKGGGLKLAKAELSNIMGLPIQYAAVLDFSKFESLIDFLGGVEIQVDRSFTDKKFPIAGRENDQCQDNDPEFSCRYQTITFKQGLTTMNGETALKFVRSRNAIGPEGSDFARETRQQKVIDAVEKKLTALVKSLNLKNIADLYQQSNQLISRDITNQQLSIVAKNIVIKKIFGKNLSRKQVTLPENFFIIPPYYEYDGKYVLIPEDKDFSKIHQYIACQISNSPNSCK